LAGKVMLADEGLLDFGGAGRVYCLLTMQLGMT